VTVTLTMTTIGPNLGTQSGPRGAVLRTAWTAGGGRPYALFMWVVLVRIVGSGRKRRGKPRLYGEITAICLGLGLTALISCGGVSGSGGAGPAPDFAIAVTPIPNSTVVNQSITWNGTLTALNGFSGSVALTCTSGAPLTCTPSSSVTPTAEGTPFAVTLGSATAGTFTFTISGTDGTLTNATPSETLTVGTAATPVTVNPQTGTLLFADEPGNSWPAGGNQQQFTANQSVTWAVTGGNANGTIGGTGMYTPPAVVPNPATVTVTATPATAAAPGSAFLTVAAPTVVGTSQIVVTATAAGGTAHWDVVTLNVQ